MRSPRTVSDTVSVLYAVTSCGCAKLKHICWLTNVLSDYISHCRRDYCVRTFLDHGPKKNLQFHEFYNFNGELQLLASLCTLYNVFFFLKISINDRQSSKQYMRVNTFDSSERLHFSCISYIF